MGFGPADLIPQRASPGGHSPHQRLASSLRIWFCLFWLALLVGTTAMIAVGGRPDPAGVGQYLDGDWRFHPGDNPAWADPAMNDADWDRLTLFARPDLHDGDVGLPGYFDGWRAHGHPQLSGYGWYRRQVIVPAQGDFVLVAPPSVEDGYELFWDGHRIGGVGKLSGVPRVSITRPVIAYLPASGAGHVGLVAIRAFMQPGAGRDDKSGGLRTLPVLAPRAQGEALYRAQWRRTIAGYIVEVTEPVAMLVLAVLALLAAPGLARPGFARWIALGLLAIACQRLGNAVGAWTDLYDLPPLLHSPVVVAPIAKLAWTLGWNQWTDGRDRRWVAWTAIAAWILLVAGALLRNPQLGGAGRILIALSLAAIAVRIVRHGEHKWLLFAAMLLIATGLFAADLSALGVPGIWFPFNIGVSRSQFAYALALPLVAWALAAACDRGRSPPTPA